MPLVSLTPSAKRHKAAWDTPKKECQHSGRETCDRLYMIVEATEMEKMFLP